MVAKPPVDIEWYNDGLTLEEQHALSKKISKQKKNARLKLTVTEKQKEDWKDALISKLRSANAANEEYINELEDAEKGSKEFQAMKQELEELKKQNANMKSQLTAYNSRYSNDIQVYFKEKYADELLKHSVEIDMYKEQINMYMRQRDEAIKRIIELTNGTGIN
jgi:hypothetical protein